VFLVGKPDERNDVEDLGIEERTILKWIFKEQDRGLDCVNLAQDKDRWRAVVKAVMNLQVRGNFLTNLGNVSF
jgi:hypothetical protein